VIISMDTQNIEPKQALEILSQVALQFRGTRQEHEVIEKALRSLAQLIETGGAAQK
jgi:hypothetical protein